MNATVNSLTPEKFNTPIDEAKPVEMKNGRTIRVILVLLLIFQIEIKSIFKIKLIISTIESTMV